MGFVFHCLIISGIFLSMTVFWAGYPICNPMLVYVVYLGLKVDFFPGLILAVVTGVLLDGFSGSPVGISLFTFLWVFCIVRWLSGFLRITSPFFPLLAVLSGISLEFFFTFLVLIFRSQGQGVWEMGLYFLFLQLGTALIFCPLLLIFFRETRLRFLSGKGLMRSVHDSSPSVSIRG